MVGVDQTAAPDGPRTSAPDGLVPLTFGSSSTVYVCHKRRPVAASSATTLPRKVQHVYWGCSGMADSYDDTPT